MPSQLASNPVFIVVGIFILITFLIEIVFYGIIFPILVFLDMKNNNELSGKSKWAWIFSIISTWTFGSLAYGFWGTKKKSLNIMSIVCVVLVVLQVVVIAGVISVYSKEIMAQQLPW